MRLNNSGFALQSSLPLHVLMGQGKHSRAYFTGLSSVAQHVVCTRFESGYPMLGVLELVLRNAQQALAFAQWLALERRAGTSRLCYAWMPTCVCLPRQAYSVDGTTHLGMCAAHGFKSSTTVHKAHP